MAQRPSFTQAPGTASGAADVGRSRSAHPPSEPRRGRRGGWPQPGDTITLKLLVIATDADDPNLAAITQLLETLGTPHDVLVAGRQRLTREQLAGPDLAHYQGVIVIASDFQPDASRGAHGDPLSRGEWAVLRAFAARFAIRQAILYCPARGRHRRFGLAFKTPVDTGAQPAQLTLTPAGRDVFWYLNPNVPLAIRDARLLLARPLDNAMTPLLVSGSGAAAAAVGAAHGGCETLVLAIGQGPDMTHTLLLGYGLIKWVCRGLFLGEHRVYLNLQVDDVFAGAELWDPRQQAELLDRPFRLTGDDVKTWLDRQEELRRSSANATDLRLDLAFNGGGVTWAPPGDTLVSALATSQAHFRWINHSFSHPDCDVTDYTVSLAEIQRNNEMAGVLGLTHYHPDCMVTPSMSGLTNAEFLRAAADAGVRYLVCDTSQPGWQSPRAHKAIPCSAEPAIRIVPRHPTNVFANVSTPEEWCAEYNHTYRDYWGCDLDYAEILDSEAEVLVGYLLRFDVAPLMFHQANLRSYDGRHSLLSDLVQCVLNKYDALCEATPIRCLGLHEIGEVMQRREVYDSARIEAHFIRNVGLAIVADRDVLVPITGACAGPHSEHYAGQSLSWLPVAAHASALIPLPHLAHDQSAAGSPDCEAV